MTVVTLQDRSQISLEVVKLTYIYTKNYTFSVKNYSKKLYHVTLYTFLIINVLKKSCRFMSKLSNYKKHGCWVL